MINNILLYLHGVSKIEMEPLGMGNYHLGNSRRAPMYVLSPKHDKTVTTNGCDAKENMLRKFVMSNPRLHCFLSNAIIHQCQ